MLELLWVPNYVLCRECEYAFHVKGEGDGYVAEHPHNDKCSQSDKTWWVELPKLTIVREKF